VRSHYPAANHRTIDDFASTVPILGVDVATATLFGTLKAHLRTQGMCIEDLDLLIGATALAHDLTLVTNNADHFGRMDRLRMDSWTRAAASADRASSGAHPTRGATPQA
jgi:tRNA(fMet)-specific endonuclease VapC